MARSDAAPPEQALTPAPAHQPDVLLLGAAPAPAALEAWATATDAWQITVVEGDLASGVRSPADRLAGRSLGLVLAGGGARAFAHVGVLRQFEDRGLHVDRVAGSSVGAIIASLHAYGNDGAALEEILYAEFVRRRPFSDWGLPTTSLARGRRMYDAAARNFGDSCSRACRVAARRHHRPGHSHPPGASARTSGPAVVSSTRLPVMIARSATTPDGCSSTGGFSTTCRSTC